MARTHPSGPSSAAVTAAHTHRSGQYVPITTQPNEKRAWSAQRPTTLAIYINIRTLASVSLRRLLAALYAAVSSARLKWGGSADARSRRVGVAHAPRRA